MNNKATTIAKLCILLFLSCGSFSTSAQSLNSLDSLRQLAQNYSTDTTEISADRLPTLQVYLTKAKFFNSREDIIYAYQQLAAINYQLGMVNNSLKYYKLYVLELERLSDIESFQEQQFEKNLFENEIRALNIKIDTLERQNEQLKATKLEYFSANSKIYLGLRLIIAIAAVLLIGWLYLRYRKPKKVIAETKVEVAPQKALTEILNNTKSDLIKVETELDLSDFLVNQIITSPEEYFFANKSLRKKFLIYQAKKLSGGVGLFLSSAKNITTIITFEVPSHGAAGGLLSEHVYKILNDLVKLLNINSPALILTQIEERINALFPAGIPFNGGIRMAVCAYNNSEKSLTYAGADFNLYQVHNGICTRHDGNTRSLVTGEIEAPYNNTTIEVQKGFNFYLSTNGYWTQPGGHDYKPFGETAFRTAVESLSKQQLPEHKKILEKIFNDWLAGNEQEDDLLLFGFGF